MQEENVVKQSCRAVAAAAAAAAHVYRHVEGDKQSCREIAAAATAYFKAKFLFDSSYVPHPRFHSGSGLKNMLCDSKQA